MTRASQPLLVAAFAGLLTAGVSTGADAVPLLQKILIADPHNLDAVLRLATAHGALGRAAQADQLFERAAMLAPGSADVRMDFDRLLRLWRAGRLDLEGMITSRIDLNEVNEAFEMMKRGEGIRSVIELA